MKYVKSFLEIFVIMAKTFPKLFANMFSFIPYVGIVIKFLPELITTVKMIYKMIGDGVTDAQVRRKLKRIDNAKS